MGYHPPSFSGDPLVCDILLAPLKSPGAALIISSHLQFLRPRQGSPSARGPQGHPPQHENIPAGPHSHFLPPHAIFLNDALLPVTFLSFFNVDLSKLATALTAQYQEDVSIPRGSSSIPLRPRPCLLLRTESPTSRPGISWTRPSSPLYEPLLSCLLKFAQDCPIGSLLYASLAGPNPFLICHDSTHRLPPPGSPA